MQKETEKINNSDIMEGMSSVSAVIKSIERGHSDRKIYEILIDPAKKKSKEKEIAFLQRKASGLNFSIRFVEAEYLNSITVGNSHGGIVALCTNRSIPLLENSQIKENGVYYMLEGVEDPYNFGYAIRSLYALGADGIILTPRNWMGVAGVVARSSAGASELMDMYVCEPIEAVEKFKSCGYEVVCAGIRNSVSIFQAELKKPIFLIIGGEKRGISRAVLDACDKVVRIDYGNEFNGSLSTAASAAVFAFEILKSNS